MRIAELEKNVERLKQKAATNSEEIRAVEETVSAVNRSTGDIKKVRFSSLKFWERGLNLEIKKCALLPSCPARFAHSLAKAQEIQQGPL